MRQLHDSIYTMARGNFTELCLDRNPLSIFVFQSFTAKRDVLFSMCCATTFVENRLQQNDCGMKAYLREPGSSWVPEVVVPACRTVSATGQLLLMVMAPSLQAWSEEVPELLISWVDCVDAHSSWSDVMSTAARCCMEDKDT